ncbi:MAG: LUD domain-containing protein [Methanobacteriaceae archaeon]|nr:LUD domain-containing protein [Methanobacteriaceae archaeon]
MNKSQLNTMQKSFELMDKRRKSLLDNKKTKELIERVKNIRKDSINNLPKLIKTAKKRLKENGIDVRYAETADDALNIINDIIGDNKVIGKSKSNTIAEIGLADYLKSKEVELIETDLGDRIVQLNPGSNRSSHPIGPALHLNIERIAEIVSENLGITINPEPREILDILKSNVLEELSQCSIGITGSNSVAAEDGSVVIVHNEGNVSLVSMMDTHIVLVGIDKLVHTIEEAISVVKVETMYATGTRVPSYINVISGPSKTADIEKRLIEDMYGAKKVVVILLDNGRSKALKECLWCIGCGSCIVSCPVYNAVGYEFGYRGYLGGRGVAFSKFIKDVKASYQSGLFCCTLCGLCSLECPVSTPTNEIIEKLRKESVESGIYNKKHLKIANNIKNNGSPFDN